MTRRAAISAGQDQYVTDPRGVAEAEAGTAIRDLFKDPDSATDRQRAEWIKQYATQRDYERLFDLLTSGTDHLDGIMMWLDRRRECGQALDDLALNDPDTFLSWLKRADGPVHDALTRREAVRSAARIALDNLSSTPEHAADPWVVTENLRIRLSSGSPGEVERAEHDAEALSHEARAPLTSLAWFANWQHALKVKRYAEQNDLEALFGYLESNKAEVSGVVAWLDNIPWYGFAVDKVATLYPDTFFAWLERASGPVYDALRHRKAIEDGFDRYDAGGNGPASETGNAAPQP